MSLSLRFILPLMLALAAIAYSVVPLVDQLTLRWFVRDLDIRAELVANSLQEPLQEHALFERLLASRNRHGLLAEHIDPKSGEQWGNFVQTYSMVGLINSAIRLSVRWDQAF